MSGEVATVPAVASGIAEITQQTGFYSSLKTETRSEKMAFLRAINNSENLKDAIKGAPESKLGLKIVDIVLQSVPMENEQTGEIEDAVRSTLITEEGTAYHATSKGVANSLKQALGVFGTPDTWDEPLEVVAAEEKGRNGFYFVTLKF